MRRELIGMFIERGASDDPAVLARAAHIVRAAMERRRLVRAELEGDVISQRDIDQVREQRDPAA